MRSLVLAAFLCTPLLWSCASEAGSQPAAETSEIPCEQPRRVGLLPAAIDEGSGVAFSRAHQGVLWVHNDSDPHLYAVDRTGRLLGRLRLQPPTPDDWEDIALARCGERDCLYLADIGDNEQRRPAIDVYRIPEPSPRDRVTARPQRFSFRFPDGPRDAEALFVLPGERVYIITKGRRGSIALYRARLSPGDTTVLEQVRSFTPGLVQIPDQVTGADASPDGHWLAVRTYSYLDLYRVLGDSIATGAAARVMLGQLAEPQGEGVALNDRGELFLVSERAHGPRAPLSWLRCELP